MEDTERSKKISMTQEDLATVVAAAVANAVKESSKMMADAILESRKPYKKPEDEANEKLMRQSMKEQRERLLEQVRQSQRWCKHLQGSNALSRLPGQLTCIGKHRLDTGEIVGICLNCGKLWRQGDPDYMDELSRASGCEMSTSGQRQFLDPTAVIKAGQGPRPSLG